MTDLSDIYINIDNVPTTPMRRAWSGTGTISIPRNDSRNGITIEAAAANTGTITYQYVGGPNTNAVMDLLPGGAVENSRVKGNNCILGLTVTCGSDAARIEEW